MKRTYNVDDLPPQLRRHIEVVESHWLWTGRCTSDGYGQVRWQGKTRPAHAVIYALATGQSVVPGLVHRHGQDCPRNCCNPAHINIGTQADNCADRDAAGRTARGSRNGRAKLHDEWILVLSAGAGDEKRTRPALRRDATGHQLCR